MLALVYMPLSLMLLALKGRFSQNVAFQLFPSFLNIGLIMADVKLTRKISFEFWFLAFIFLNVWKSFVIAIDIVILRFLIALATVDLVKVVSNNFAKNGV